MIKRWVCKTKLVWIGEESWEEILGWGTVSYILVPTRRWQQQKAKNAKNAKNQLH
jgi:hypothetical protein